MPKKTAKRRGAARAVRRSRRSFGAVYAIVSALVILLAVFGGVTVFFRLEQYEIVGTTR